MSLEEYFRILRRRWLVGLAVLVGMIGATVALSLFIPPKYQATATLWIGHDSAGENPWDAGQIDQMLVRTYGELIRSPNVTVQVAEAMGDGWSSAGVEGRMSFRVIEGTHLIEVTAGDGNPQVAQRLANVYAATFATTATGLAAPNSPRGVFVSVTDPAALPEKPVRPRPVLYIVVGAVLAVFTAAGSMPLVDRLDRRINSEEEAVRLLQLPVLGRMPRGKTRFVWTPAQREAARTLAANLRFQLSSASSAAIAVTSPGPQEGKSTVVSFLARALAETGASVVAMDADLRQPSLHKAFGLNVSPGLTDHVAFGLGPEKVVRAGGEKSLGVITAGPPPPNPVMFLESDRLRDLLRSLSTLARLVIIDTPPTSVAADATILSMSADAVVMVVDLKKTDRVTAVQSLEQLRQAGARILGMIVNGAPLSRHQEYGPYYREPTQSRVALRLGGERRAQA